MLTVSVRAAFATAQRAQLEPPIIVCAPLWTNGSSIRYCISVISLGQFAAKALRLLNGTASRQLCGHFGGNRSTFEIGPIFNYLASMSAVMLPHSAWMKNHA